MRVRSDGAAVPRHRNSTDSHSPNRAADQPPRVLPRPGSPHKISVSKGLADSPEKRRLTTFGSAGCITHPERKCFAESHAQRSSPITTRHASLGDHKAFEAEALAEVRDAVWALIERKASALLQILCFNYRTRADPFWWWSIKRDININISHFLWTFSFYFLYVWRDRILIFTNESVSGFKNRKNCPEHCKAMPLNPHAFTRSYPSYAFQALAFS